MLIRYIVALSIILNPFIFAIPAQRILQADKIEGIVTQKEFVGSKGHFEKNVAGVTAYADAAATSPVDGTGGDPNTTCTRTTTSPITGDGSLLITKTSGASRQGEGCGMAFTTDSNHYGRMLTISADYIVGSGTFTAGSSSTDSDLTVWLYDVTNAVIIQPSNYKFFSSSTTLTDRFVGQFQTASNSSSYRLIFHIGTTDTDAMTLKIDNISVSPQGTTLAPIVTDWKSYTPAFTGTTNGLSWSNSTVTGKYRQVGDSMEVVIYTGFSGAPGTGTGNFQWALPSGYSIDTAKLPVTTTARFGFGQPRDGTTTFEREMYGVTYASSTTVTLNGRTDSGSSIIVNATTPFTVDANSGINLSFKVPISGWSSGLEIGDNYSGREIVARGYFTGQTGYASGSYITADIGGVTFDTTSMVSVGIDTVTVPSAGKYEIYAGMSWSNNSSGQRLMSYSVNAGTEVVLGKVDNPSGTNNSFANGSNVSNLNAGDVIRFRFQSSSVSPDTNPDGISSWYVKKSQSQAAIASGEKVAARYTTNAGQSIANVTMSTVLFEDLDFDTHGAYNTSTGFFTAPISGLYTVSSTIMYDAQAFSLDDKVSLSLAKNGDSETQSLHYHEVPVTTTTYLTLQGTTTIMLNAGDYIGVRTYQNSGSAKTLISTGLYNYISITKF